MAMKRRMVSLVVIGSVKYCSNDCPGMSGSPLTFVEGTSTQFHCYYFDERLVWDPKRETHGNLRPQKCSQSELA